MTIFRPVIDLHEGRVKQIVGESLTGDRGTLQTNFVAEHGATWFAEMYCRDQLTGGHLIMLGPGNDKEALKATRAYPGGLQVGGGMTPERAPLFLSAGASGIIVTSWLFAESLSIDMGRLQAFENEIGADKLVIDLSCRKIDSGWAVAIHKWQTVTRERLTLSLLERLSSFCNEFLIHAADVEGKQSGMDEELVQMLGTWEGPRITYAGGIRSIEDLARVNDWSEGRVDLAIGSALDLFGGSQIRYEDCVAWNRQVK